MSEIVVFVRSQPQLGDQIVAMPTLYQLKTWWPCLDIKVVARDNVGGFYRALPWVEEFVRASTFSDYLRSLKKNTRICVSLHHSSERFGLVNLLRRPPIRLGFRNARISDLAWTHGHRKDITEYIGLANLRLLASYRPLDPASATRACFQTLARPHLRTVHSADVVMIPGGGSGAFKRWSLANYLLLAEQLKRQLGKDTRFLFVLGRQEDAERDALLAMQRPDLAIAYCRPIPELSAIMLRARLVVANDCGPSHIAQGACVPYVGIFNEPNPEWFWQRPGAASVVPRHPQDRIDAITPDDVLAACLNVLEHHAHTAYAG
ncbi:MULTISPECIES: glycosyltransferase family 9 protein [Achromobacter]|uniref:Glycosyltransferase family 9 protein n=1 Tax=Achromobacter spanius TaxID=217203 RepID=A0ABY8GLR3_9BURK|nr:MULTISPECIES: glycosyltransferase family 9 protein [Achromobacter]WAI85133.1 glycosyltransferase family 9 protein [Achromobacter spanius]WEX95215.1 glycosyltransferase family 9 protein [Achromobacter sp. SS2-2022]WFP05615.1 glycosyltransferase family 9 protein [Achromobacter spanius]